MIDANSWLFQSLYAGPKFRMTDLFYNRILELISAESRVLNLGAGPAGGVSTRCLRGRCAELVGADIDPVVVENDELDSAHLIRDGRLPFQAETFDLVYADYVLEHVEKPTTFLAEVARILKSGRPFLFRTPNKNHYVALVARMTPHSVHVILANRMRGLSAETHDPWPTFYRLNTRKQIRAAAAAAGFEQTRLEMLEGHPSYLMFATIPFLLGAAYERAVNATSLLAGARASIVGELWR